MVPAGDKYDENKSLYLGHNLTILPGTTPKTTSPGDIHEIIKKEN